MPMGSISVANGTGEAELSFSVSGPKATGSVLLKAKKTFDAWRIERLLLTIEGDDAPIDLLGERHASTGGASPRLSASG